MHEKREFPNIKGNMCDVPFESANIYVLPRWADSNEIITVNLRRNLKYKSYIYFEPVCPCAIYQALGYLKLHNKFFEDIFSWKSLTRNEMFRCSEMGDVEEENLETAPGKIIQNEPLFTLIEHPLNMHRAALTETALVSEMPIINNKVNVTIAPEQGKTPVSMLHEDT